MASVKLFKQDGSESAAIQVSDAVFAIEANDRLVHQVAVALRNNCRQGNAHTKTRAEVSGGGIKPYKQKGTGRARHGSSRESQMRGGGTMWGPRKHGFRQDVPVKMKRKALCCVLSDRARNDKLCVLEGLVVDAPKTKPMVELYGKLAPEGRRTLIVTAKNEPTIVKSAGNVPRLTVRTAADVNALDVLSATRVVVVRDALSVLEERLS